MIAFHVEDMSCGHCVAAITQAVQAVAPGAQVNVDLAAHRVEVASAEVDSSVLRAAIEEAGYSPQPL
ncbi:heavy-metal-associated domain-containing protein [Aquincola sp. MAHUQ-54]|uniref:Heavy-metal-associated domain-containing protein n=1 Tax=Aquincola agrisoli TaxID=3119538 RepID=A0AAW9QD82_9BURK